MKLLFLIRGLHLGGAERQLATLARALRHRGHQVEVAVFYAGGTLEEEVRAGGVPVHDLEKRGRWDVLGALVRLGRLVRSRRPDAVLAYMNLANLYSAGLRWLAPGVPVVWGIRSAMEDLRAYDWMSTLGSGLEVLAARAPDVIVANSEAARRHAVGRGMSERKLLVIPNGIDCEAFRPDPAGRERVRRGWGVPAGAPLVGMIARLDPVKGHPTFLRAAALLAAAREDVRFVCVGDGRPEYRSELFRLAGELGLGARLTWAGPCKADAAIHGALDVSVLSSDDGESFPNVIAEAMACGVPCVATDSGDASWIIGDTGVAVPPKDPAALAAGVSGLLARSGAQRAGDARRARDRVVREFSVPTLVSRTEAMLKALRAEADPFGSAPDRRRAPAP